MDGHPALDEGGTVALGIYLNLPCLQAAVTRTSWTCAPGSIDLHLRVPGDQAGLSA